MSRLPLVCCLIAGCAAPRVVDPPYPQVARPTPAAPPSVVATAPTGADLGPPIDAAALWDSDLGPPVRSTALVTSPPLVLPFTWPLRPAVLTTAERARLMREVDRVFPGPGGGEPAVASNGTISITDRRWPTGAILPASGPWHLLATASALVDDPAAAASLQAVYGGRALWGAPTLAVLRRVEPDPSGAIRFCGFPGAVPRCVLVANGLVETTPDNGALWKLARDPARLDHLRAAAPRGTYTLKRSRRALVWQDAHGIGCEGYHDVACDQITVSAGLQPVGPANVRTKSHTVVAAELEAKAYLLIRCAPHERLSIVAVIRVAAEPARRGPSVEETVTVVGEDPAVYDTITGARLGTFTALQQRGAVLWPFGDDHDESQIRGAVAGTYCGT